ncbi:retinol-binding protein pinta-like [Schistocerca piceifrons]|uniref:retinol-binding protein pinta-like n=1 Tax=Schistocerca piceifrons TaxID=274613 RepID=UPI001F5ECC71|nr:retinol-binding protein pinta-like [Schistocerca piceifrons]XP_047099833.1 retinol-binding protein pinta-like [Schistocerca piceifrons]XP_047099834.1 retinol-binding protein pinta-like [Schistocerca piceifrons]
MWTIRETCVTMEEEMKRNPELNQADLDHLKAWLSKQPHLPDIDDLQLVLFLHSCHYRLEAAKNTIDAAYTARTHMPDLFTDRDPLLPVNVATNEYLYGMAGRSPDGDCVVLMRLRNTEPALLNYSDCFRAFFMLLDVWQRREGTAPGLVLIFDMSGVVFGHLLRLTPGPLSRFLYYLQEALPVRIKAIHYINVVPFMDKFLALMKPFMKKELIDMLHLHTEGLHTLEPFVPLKLLPKEVGGEGETLEAIREKTIEVMKANRDFLVEEEKRRVDESRRQGKPKAGTPETLYGVEGSFKKLDID